MQGIYQMCYDLLKEAIFAGDFSGAVYAEFFCQGISVLACAFLISVPFLILWRVIRRFL